MKKCIAMMMAMLMICLVGLAGCGDANKSDVEYIKDKGTLVVGITDFAPMDYKDADGNWIGFDADLAKGFAEELGVKVEFVEITWGQKANELKTKNIDMVWNGMTLTEDVKAQMDCSLPYCRNAQVVVMKQEAADSYKDVDSMKDLQFAVENGSAGEEMATANSFKITEVDKQAKALMEVASGTCDAAIIDMLMAGAMIGEGTDYADLTYSLELNSEEYGIGMRQGSDLVEKLNTYLKAAYADGTVANLAETYGISDNVMEIK